MTDLLRKSHPARSEHGMMIWPLRRKILAGYSIIMILTGVILGLALLNILRLGGASDAILQENYRSILAAEQMLNALHRQENAALLLAIGANPETVTQFSEAERQFLTWLGRAKDNVTIEGEDAILERIDSSYSAFLYELTRLRQPDAGDSNNRLNLYRTELVSRADAVRRACNDLHRLNRETMETASARAHRIARMAVWSMVAAGVLMFSIAVGLSILLANRIVRPIHQLAEATEQVAAGNYDVAIHPESNDEVGQLAEKFGVMLSKLRTYHRLNIERFAGEQRKAAVILNIIDDGVFVVSADHKISSINPSASRVLNVPGEVATGMSIEQAVREPQLRELIVQTLASGEAPRLGEGGNYLSLTAPGGSEQHFEYSATPIRAPDERTIGAVVLLRNVTQLKQLDRLKSEFVMTASHELRSPLTSIAMSVDLLQERLAAKLEEPDRQLLDVAQEELNRLRALVNELLDLSKIETGRIEMDLSEQPIEPILETAIAPFRAQAEKQGITLELIVKEAIPPVTVDASKLAWVIVNLIGNALRYAHHLIQVSAEAAGHTVQIYVRDDGEGIPYELQARIFDKFVQIGQKPRGGAGLGLAIAKEIVRAHRGHIWVESEPGRGSMFIITLPVSRSAGAPAADSLPTGAPR